MKKIVFLVMSLLFVSCQPQGGKAGGEAKNVTLNSEDDKILYTMGNMMGGHLKTLSLSDSEMNALLKGLQDASKGTTPEVNVAEYQDKVRTFFQDRLQKGTEKVKVEGNEFLEKFAKEEGVQKTASGLLYKIIKPGSDAKPKDTDTVEVHYHGTLTDGTVFDSSVERKQTISFPLNRVIKGWTEGLQLIGEGGKIKLVIPSDLGYGDAGAPPKIPGGATLVFDVELFKIKAEEAPQAIAPAAAKEVAPAKSEKKSDKK